MIWDMLTAEVQRATTKVKFKELCIHCVFDTIVTNIMECYIWI